MLQESTSTGAAAAMIGVTLVPALSVIRIIDQRVTGMIGFAHYFQARC